MPTELIKCVTCGHPASEKDFISGTNRFKCSACGNLMRDLGDRVVAVKKHPKRIHLRPETETEIEDEDSSTEDSASEPESSETPSSDCLGSSLGILFIIAVTCSIIFTSAPVIYSAIATLAYAFFYTAFCFDPKVGQDDLGMNLFLISVIAFLGFGIYFVPSFTMIPLINWVIGSLLGLTCFTVTLFFGLIFNAITHAGSTEE